MRAMVRWVLGLLLFLQAILPLLFLALLSVGEGWFFPRLLPEQLTLAGWGEALGVAWRADGLPSGWGRLGRAASSSLLLGTLTATLGSGIALLAGRRLARLRGWRLHLATAGAFLPIAAPPVALGAGLHLIVLRGGLGGSHLGVLAGHLVPASAYLTLFFLGVFSLRDDRLQEGARTLGATSLQTLRLITFPTLAPAIATAWILGFLISWAQVPLTLILGGGAVSTLPVEVLAYASSGQDRHAAVGALLLTVPPLLLMAGMRWAFPSDELLPV